MPYTDLRLTDDVRQVQVLVDGGWVSGDLEAYRHDGTGAWYGWVRWSRIAGQTHAGWFGEHQLRKVERL